MSKEVFSELVEISNLLYQASFPWAFAGGWGIDVAIERETREHKDIEITLLRPHFELLYNHIKKGAWSFIVQGSEFPLTSTEELPEESHELVVRTKNTELEILLTPFDTETEYVICRRDLSLRMPIRKVFLQSACTGLPFLWLPWNLLFKAKYLSDHNSNDFFASLPHMNQEERQWLQEALLKQFSTHLWIEHLR